jgi:hypothetical protein
MAHLIVASKIGHTPLSWKCSECEKIFPLPGGRISDQEKIHRVVTDFALHKAKEHGGEDISEDGDRIGK